MGAQTHGVIKERCYEDRETGGETQKAHKKRKIEESDICPNHQEIKTSSKVKKPRLSTRMFGEGQIGYEQLYELLKYATLGKHHNVTQPSWCRIHHQRHLAGVVVVVLHHVDQLHFYRYYLQFKHLRKTFRHRFSLPSISGDLIKNFCGVGINDHQQLSREEMDDDPIIQKYAEKGCSLSSYILTPEEMHLHDYPLEDNGDCSHFVRTHCNGPVTDGSPLFGLDCEMCLTEKGSELTRIAVVDANGRCVMNELVKPKLPIRNYLTCYSGITEKLLRPVQTTLAEIQGRLKNLLPSDAILVGHSLNADLRALEMIHPNVIDTSLLFARKGGKRFKLKFLAAAVLGEDIQSKAQMGHDPTEDAKCALELAQYFIEQGPRKVAELNLEARLSEQRKVGEAEIWLRAKQKIGVRNPSQGLLASLQSIGQKTLLLGEQNNVQNHTASLNKQVLQKALEEIPKSSFSIIQFALDSKHVTADLLAESSSKMRAKFSDMLTVYAGPFTKDVCLKTVKKAFRKCGHVRSIQIISETFKPHLCIQYEVLEAVQLALEDLNGAEVAGSAIKVQRPVTEMTLDCEMLVKELERDRENEGVLYMAGLGKRQGEMELQKHLGHLKGLRSVFWPRDPQTGRRRNYCFLQPHQLHPTTTFSIFPILSTHSLFLHGFVWQSYPHSFSLYRIPAPRERLRGPPNPRREHLAEQKSPHTFHPLPVGLPHKGKGQRRGRTPGEAATLRFESIYVIFPQELGLKKAIKTLDHSAKTLHEWVPDYTLCLVLLPGTNRLPGSPCGLGLLGIKGEENISTSC